VSTAELDCAVGPDSNTVCIATTWTARMFDMAQIMDQQGS
jgi:hypothetical protein